MSASFTTAEVITVVTGSSVLSSGITALAGRRASTFAVFTDAYDKLAKRVGDLETKLGSVEVQLDTEKEQHRKTRNLLRTALGHIRDVVAWGAGARTTALPAPPADLLSET